MTTATGEKLGQTGVQDDYGQALAEGEITRLLKTVQAAQFKKSENLATTEDTEFKPRTLVEIAFASEQKQKQVEEAAQQHLKQQSTELDAGEPASAAKDEAGVSAAVGQDSLLHTPSQHNASTGSVADEVVDEAAQHAEEAVKQQRAEENEAIRIAAEEAGYKRGFEAGLEAARTAEPTPEEMAFLEEKEKERQAIIDQFHKVIAAIASPQAIDSSALEEAINAAVVDLASERAGQVISENPEAFLVRIKKLVDDIKIGTQQVEILLNPSDLAAIKGWVQDKPMPTGWQFLSDEMLANGDMRLKLGGMEISDKVHPDLNEKVEALGQNSEEIYENLKLDQFEVSPEQSLEENEQLRSDDQNTESLSEVTADETSSVPVLEGFEPIETEDEQLQSDDQNTESLSEVTADETSSIPVLEGFEPIETEDEQLQSDDQNTESLSEVTADETSSIPVLEGFEPIETEDEQLQSDDQNTESLSEVTADETSSIPVLEGFEPIETEDEQLQSDDQNSSLQRAKVAKRPTFIPDSTEEVDLEDEISSIPVLEGFEPIKGDE